MQSLNQHRSRVEAAQASNRPVNGAASDEDQNIDRCPLDNGAAMDEDTCFARPIYMRQSSKRRDPYQHLETI